MWFENKKLLAEMAESPSRQRWANDEAVSVFDAISGHLDASLRQRNRIGPLVFQEVPGVEGLCCCMVPVDGSASFGKIIGAHHHVKLIDDKGGVFFEGIWGDTDESMIRTHSRFFVWMEPASRKENVFR